MDKAKVTVRLTAERRSGFRSEPAGTTVEVEDWEAAWLVERGLAVPVTAGDRPNRETRATCLSS